MISISIIIPTYNRALIIEKAIASVMNQSNGNWELILVDDGSKDETEEVVKPYLIDSRIKYLYQENKGACAARNNGAKMASHDYLGFFDSDDYIGEDWVADFIQKIEEDKTAQIIFCDCIHQDITTGAIVKEVFPVVTTFSSKQKVLFYGGCFIMKKEIFFSVDGFDEISRTGYFEPLLMKLDINHEFEKMKISYVHKFNSIIVEHTANIRTNYKLKHQDVEAILKKYFMYLFKRRHFNAISNFSRIIAYNLSQDATKSYFFKVLKYSILSIIFKPFGFKHYLRVSKYLLHSLKK
jgi:glycosyltransferase involved in cell wall biosynthesis